MGDVGGCRGGGGGVMVTGRGKPAVTTCRSCDSHVTPGPVTVLDV